MSALHVFYAESLQPAPNLAKLSIRYCGKKTGKVFYAAGDSSGYVTLTFKSGYGDTKRGFLIQITDGEGKNPAAFWALSRSTYGMCTYGHVST